MKQMTTLIKPYEWPTWLAILGCYGVFVGALVGYAAAPSLVWCLPMALCAGLHSSLQHECIHGHPTRYQWFNTALIFWPLIPWTCYLEYRRSHLAHHVTDELTHPKTDPESYFFTAEDWAALSRPMRWLYRINSCLIGRLVLGPWLGAWAGVRQLLERPTGEIMANLSLQLIGLVGLGLGLIAAGMSLWVYLFCVAWPGAALISLRSYYEHRPAQSNEESTAIVETNVVLSFLFLHNNLHIVHHTLPGVPWYAIPRVYREKKAHWQRLNGAYWFSGYHEIGRRYGLSVKDELIHHSQRQSKEIRS